MEEPRTAALRETLEEAGLGEGQLTVHWDIQQELRWGSRQQIPGDRCYGVLLQVREEGAAQGGHLLAGEAAEL